MTQSGSGVSNASFGNGFNQSGRVLIIRRWAAPVSFEYERCTLSGIGMSSIGGRKACFYLEELEGASLVSEFFQDEDF
ncbi:hypothetical protein Tco_0346713 [Tanacetum coccineum]